MSAKFTHLFSNRGQHVTAIQRGWWCPVCKDFAYLFGDIIYSEKAFLMCACGEELFKTWLPVYSERVRKK